MYLKTHGLIVNINFVHHDVNNLNKKIFGTRLPNLMSMFSTQSNLKNQINRI